MLVRCFISVVFVIVEVIIMLHPLVTLMALIPGLFGVYFSCLGTDSLSAMVIHEGLGPFGCASIVEGSEVSSQGGSVLSNRGKGPSSRTSTACLFGTKTGVV